MTESAPAAKSSAPRDEHDDDLAYDELASSLGSMHITQDRKYMATRYLRHGKDARYAIKILSDDIKEDSQRFIAGVVDLAMEAKFLAVIRHPNIVKMRGMANLTPFEPGFFIVMDRLYDIMSDRLKAWVKRASQLKGIGRMMDRKGEKKKEFAFDRFLVALDLCSALGFLHTNKYVPSLVLLRILSNQVSDESLFLHFTVGNFSIVYRDLVSLSRMRNLKAIANEYLNLSITRHVHGL